MHGSRKHLFAKSNGFLLCWRKHASDQLWGSSTKLGLTRTTMASSGNENIDSHLVRVPFEALKRAAKERKSIVDSAAQATAAVLSPGSNTSTSNEVPDPEDEAPEAAPAAGAQVPCTDLAASGQPLTRENHVANLDALIVKLQGLKRKLEDVSRSEATESQHCRSRLEHLHSLGAPPKGAVIPWNRQRLDRILVDHLLRRGHQQAALKLAQETGIQELCDMSLFDEASKVVSDIRRHSCTAALKWCAEHRARLKKIKSKLEFKLRVQEFIELVRRDERMPAIQYARTYLAPWAPQYMQELQRAVAALVFTRRTSCEVYRVLFDDSQWQALSELFLRDLYRLYSLPQESLLVVHLQAGLSALNTPLSYQEGCSREDPLHLPAFQRLAEGLPYAKHVHSKLICSVTREIMNDANPPMVLPNGYVYSARAVERLLVEGNGKLVCPSTGSVHSADELRRAFIV